MGLQYVKRNLLLLLFLVIFLMDSSDPYVFRGFIILEQDTFLFCVKKTILGYLAYIYRVKSEIILNENILNDLSIFITYGECCTTAGTLCEM